MKQEGQEALNRSPEFCLKLTEVSESLLTLRTGPFLAPGA